jgi:hypothetical protein
VVHFRADLHTAQSVRGTAPGARHGHQTLPRVDANGSGTAHASVSAETCSSWAAQVDWKLVISELLWAVCRASRAPLPEHAMDTRRSQGVLPMVLARRTPWCPPSLPPEPRGRHPKNIGVFLEVQGYPRGAQQRPLLTTIVSTTIGSGMGATCGGPRRPGEHEHQRSKACDEGRRGSSPGHLPARGAGRLRGAPPTPPPSD